MASEYDGINIDPEFETFSKVLFLCQTTPARSENPFTGSNVLMSRLIKFREQSWCEDDIGICGENEIRDQGVILTRKDYFLKFF